MFSTLPPAAGAAEAAEEAGAEEAVLVEEEPPQAGSQSCTNGHGTGSEQEITARDLFHKGKPPSWFSIICKSFLHKRFRSKSLWRHIKEC
jgi:hypothetical protein